MVGRGGTHSYGSVASALITRRKCRRGKPRHGARDVRRIPHSGAFERLARKRGHRRYGRESSRCDRRE